MQWFEHKKEDEYLSKYFYFIIFLHDLIKFWRQFVAWLPDWAVEGLGESTLLEL